MDIHLHSRYSLDSVMDMESAVRKCVSLGYTVMSFTDHVDFDYPGYGDKFNFDIDDYFNRIDLLRNRYPMIELLKGIEAGVTSATSDPVMSYLSQYMFDYVILSEHIVLGEDPYSEKDIYNKHDKADLYKTYLVDLYCNMNKYRDFDTLGHYDYITRYSTYEDPDMLYEQYKEEFDEIFLFIINNNKALEINTRTYDTQKYGIRHFDTKILKAYKKAGGKHVCLGSDSHDESMIGFGFDHFKQLIKESGFNELTYFKKRKPVLVPI